MSHGQALGVVIHQPGVPLHEGQRLGGLHSSAPAQCPHDQERAALQLWVVGSLKCSKARRDSSAISTRALST